MPLTWEGGLHRCPRLAVWLLPCSAFGLDKHEQTVLTRDKRSFRSALFAERWGSTWSLGL